MAEVDGVLYAMGGNDGSSSLNSVEVFKHKICFIEISFFVMDKFHKMFQRYNFSQLLLTMSQNVSEIQFFTISQ